MFLFGFRFSVFWGAHSVTIAILKLPIYKRISLRLHPLLHPITLCYIRSAVVLLGLPASVLFLILGLSTVVIFDSNLAKEVTLDCSKACIYFVLWSRDISSTSWLDNIHWYIKVLDVRNRKLLRPCFDLVSCSLSSECGLLVSSSQVWNTANWLFDGSNY